MFIGVIEATWHGSTEKVTLLVATDSGQEALSVLEAEAWLRFPVEAGYLYHGVRLISGQVQVLYPAQEGTET